MMRCRAAIVGLLGLLTCAVPARAETIVFMRHGEKPDTGLGQLDCQGLNRALALPKVLARLFDRPTMIFAPNPGIKKQDGALAYAYVRPIATIEPTAIGLGMPVETGIGIGDFAGLENALRAPALRSATVFVAWEHHDIVAVVREMMKAAGGDPRLVPEWQGSDFDSLWVLSIDAGPAKFTQLHENLNGLPKACPS